METLSWGLVETRLHSDTPWTLSIGGTRDVRIGYDPRESRFYVRLPAPENTELPFAAYSQLVVELRQDETGYFLEVSTRAPRYFPEFHRFASLLAEEYEVSDQTAAGAFHSAVKSWQEFLSRRAILTPEQQIGLFGELLVLEALMRRDGASAVMAWIGRSTAGPARHDFRIGKFDLEIKTARSAVRLHFIHGLHQLVAAPGHELYLLSVLLEAAGVSEGCTLSDQVQKIRMLVGANEASRHDLETKLASALYRDEDSGFYDERLMIAAEPHLILVDKNCPRITPTLLAREMSTEVASRIAQVSYQVNLGGLGAPPGTRTFEAVLANVKVEIE